MFDVGIGELLLCAVVALIVLGPERMPVAVRSVAKWIGTIRATLHAVKNEFEHELELDKLKQELQQTSDQAQELTRSTLREPSPKAPPAAHSADSAAESVAENSIPPRAESQLELSLDIQQAVIQQAVIQQAIDELKKASPVQPPLPERAPPSSPLDKS